MAAFQSDFDFWSMSSEEALHEVWIHVDSTKTISTTIAVVSMTMCPIIVLGNALVILSVWKDPLKTLRSSPSNFILLSMAVADFLVGLVACPLSLYWHWALSYPEHLSFLPLLVGSTLVDVSTGHMLLLTVDRFYAFVTPLQYRVKVTNKRVCIATVTCWLYFLLFGCAFGVLEKCYKIYNIMAAIHILQVFCILVCISVVYVVMLCRFHRYSKTTELTKQSTANRQMMIQRERNLCGAIAMVIGAFLLCFLPWFIAQTMTYFCLPCYSNIWLLLLCNALAVIFTRANSGINPFLYAWRLKKYRETFKHLMKKRIGLSRNQNSQVTCVYDTRL